MITRSSIPKDCDFDKDFIALCLSKQRCEKPGQKLKMYIPALMSLIDRGSPKIRRESIGTNSGMINARSNKPIAKTHVQTANYIEVEMENNSSTNSNWQRYSLYPNSNIYRSYVRPNSRFQMRFVHGFLTKPVFNTDNIF